MSLVFNIKPLSILVLLIIRSMLVLKLSQMGPCIVAACSNGHIYLWKLGNKLQNAKTHTLLAQTYELFVTKDIKSIHYVKTNRSRFSKYASYILDLDLNSFKFSGPTIYPIIRSEAQYITVTALLNSNEVIVGSTRGNIYRYDLLNKTLSKINKIQTKRQKQQFMDFFVNYTSPQAQTTSIACENQNQVFVGYSNGIISVYNAQTCRQQDSYTYNIQRGSEEQEAVIKLKLKTKQRKMYSVHQSFILLWDIKTKSVILVIEVYRPVEIIFLKDQTTAIINQTSKLTYMSQGRKNLITTVRHTTFLGVSSIIYEYNGREYLIVGGIDGIVDVFETTSHLGTCFVEIKNDSQV